MLLLLVSRADAERSLSCKVARLPRAISASSRQEESGQNSLHSTLACFIGFYIRGLKCPSQPYPGIWFEGLSAPSDLAAFLGPWTRAAWEGGVHAGGTPPPRWGVRHLSKKDA